MLSRTSANAKPQTPLLLTRRMNARSLLLACIMACCRAWNLPNKIWKRRKIHSFPPEDGTQQMLGVHRYFMQEALKQAKRAGEMGEVPIGALVVRNCTDDHQHSWEVLATGSNCVETNHDAAAHAELVALRRAAAKIKNWRLLDCVLYSTLEPCPMCLSACQAFRIGTIVYGAPDLRLGAVYTQQQLLQIPHPFHNVTTVVAGIEEEASAALLRGFFRARRLKKGTSSPPARKRFWQRKRPD